MDIVADCGMMFGMQRNQAAHKSGESEMASFKSQMLVNGAWCGNSLRFATKSEAEKYGADLFSRWTVPSSHRAVESYDPVNYAWIDGKLVDLEQATVAAYVAEGLGE